MKFSDIQKQIDHFNQAYILEGIFLHSTRVWMKKLFLAMAFFVLVFSSGVFIESQVKLSGFFYLFLLVFFILSALDAFYYSFLFEEGHEPYLYELGEIIWKTSHDDIIGGFIRSEIGRTILLRCGIDSKTLKDFFAKRAFFVSTQNFTFTRGESLFASYMAAIYESDKSFEHMLISHNVSLEYWVGCAEWVARSEKRAKSARRWWSRERLEAITPLGRDFAYGKAYTLMNMSVPLSFSAYQEHELHSEALTKLETVLTRKSEANIMLVGDEGVGKMEVVEGLARKSMRRKIALELSDKHYFVLNLEALSTKATDRRSFENIFTSILIDAVQAGNIIFIVPDMAGLLNLSQALGADLAELLNRFLTSSAFQLIAIVDTHDFNQILSPNQELMRHFEKITIPEGDEQTILETLEDNIRIMEYREKVLFSYPALAEAVKSAKRYFVDSPLFDASEDLLVGAISFARGEGRQVVYREDVLAQVQSETGVATGEVEALERDRLMNLESLLHERVIGQNEAITAISNALRRARAGVGSPEKPVGSFLFLGPTGVGKTETAKALSEIFFGAGAQMLRLDMTEYSSADSLSRLIGTYNSENAGVLGNMIREHQYGVLLLDEFEKASSEVHDLFLQVLDEGMFTDAQGRKVNARNLIIIATSNAGSQYIFDIVGGGTDLLSKRQEVTEKIISDGTFKAELLNRFDALVLFHPLSDEHLRGVAKVMLERLAWRMKQKGMTLVINDAVLNFLVSNGRDQKFGARPLNRVIQDRIEKIISDRVISGEYRVGSTIEFAAKDF